MPLNSQPWYTFKTCCLPESGCWILTRTAASVVILSGLSQSCGEETLNYTLIVGRTLRVHEIDTDAIADPQTNADSKAWSAEVVTKFLLPFHILAFQSAL